MDGPNFCLSLNLNISSLVFMNTGDPTISWFHNSWSPLFRDSIFHDFEEKIFFWENFWEFFSLIFSFIFFCLNTLIDVWKNSDGVLSYKSSNISNFPSLDFLSPKQWLMKVFGSNTSEVSEFRNSNKIKWFWWESKY